MFPCEYDEIKLVTDNLVKLYNGYQYLIFRISDQQILKQSYSFIGQPDKEGNIKVQGNNTEGYINSAGEPIYTDIETFDDRTVKICFLGKYGLKSSDGTLVIDCGLNDIRYLKRGVYAIKTGNEWGVKTKRGITLSLYVHFHRSRFGHLVKSAIERIWLWWHIQHIQYGYLAVA